MNEKESLLVEIRTEELPPAQLWELADSFPDALLASLQKEGFADSESTRAQHENGDNKKLATPRRLAAQLSNISAELSPQEIMRRGPQISACKDNDGAPTKALIGFMQSVGATCEKDLTTVTEKGKEHIAWRGESSARKLPDELATIIERVLLSLPSPRLMRWGVNEFKFIRPIRGVLLLHGKQHINGNIMGISATKTTKGHPFLSEGDIEIADVDSYIDTLKANKVIVDIDERLKIIADEMVNIADEMVKSSPQGKYEYEPITIDHRDTDEFHARFAFFALGEKEAVREFLLSNVNEENLEKRSSPLNCYASVPLTNELLREVCAMCEFPVVHKKILDEKFKNLPWQCITECMQKHQRFMPMISAECELHCGQESILYKYDSVWREHADFDLHVWKMSSLYFVVSDNTPSTLEDSESMLRNYDTVLQARLNDVQFYYEEDDKIPQEVYVEKLKNIVFHKKLGSQYERIERVCKIAANLRGGTEEKYRIKAEKFLASLPTQMVGEYPNLQAVMSYEYFGDSEIDMPAFSTYYKLETLVGLFGVGEKPTGSKDPHGLRREAMTLVQNHLSYPFVVQNLKQAIEVTWQSFSGKIDNVTEEVYEFVLERFRFFLSEHEDFQTDKSNVREAVLSQKPDSFQSALKRINALHLFMPTPECESLAAANKRIKNILRKSNAPTKLPDINLDSFPEDAEQNLYNKLIELKSIIDKNTLSSATFKFSATEANNTSQPELVNLLSILKETATLAPTVDIFFDKVLINHEDEKIRLNRFALLAELRDLLNTVGDLSYLAK